MLSGERHLSTHKLISVWICTTAGWTSGGDQEGFSLVSFDVSVVALPGVGVFDHSEPCSCDHMVKVLGLLAFADHLETIATAK